MRSAPSLSPSASSDVAFCRADVGPPWPDPGADARQETETASVSGAASADSQAACWRAMPAKSEWPSGDAPGHRAPAGADPPPPCSGRGDTSLPPSADNAEHPAGVKAEASEATVGQCGAQRPGGERVAGSDEMGEGTPSRDEGLCTERRSSLPGSAEGRNCRTVAPARGPGGGGKKEEATGCEPRFEAAGRQAKDGDDRPNGVSGAAKRCRGDRDDSGRGDREATTVGDCCSLCGLPRTAEGGQAPSKDASGTNGDKQRGQAASAADGEDDETWVCGACLRCAEEDAKTEEALWQTEQDRSGEPHPQRPVASVETPKEEAAKGTAGAGSAAQDVPAVGTVRTGPGHAPGRSAGSGETGARGCSDAEPAVSAASGTGPKRRDAVPTGSGGNAACGGRDRAGAALPAVPVPVSNPAKCFDEGTTRSTTVHIGPNHQVPALPAFFLDSSCWPRPPMDTGLDPSLTARLVYSPSALERIKLRREQEGRQDRAISSDADMTAFVKACSQNWKTRPGWQPFSPEFAYKILHYAGYDPVRALQVMNDPQFSFRDVCDPPLRKYDNKWKPKDRRGLIAATPYPPPISARGSLARRHHREVSGYSLR
ncbi:hypothetical protein NCLIV_007230 [Neospora caninum Liverpool]|uniref:ELM2 domain-containing protein n=1 Tax=Neospora caninum (strain Liverpool) TaxID=572307 RepID=F0V9T7_NEOCL|nr:hypothetical protein NCLIV_007230 [Neospora caninum Liverpool]CBZ50249.1 hypothetical protein NCLIV_007230 [Neospora caninum Liverpool]CEL64850.1 TPA: hypothetical protein BN1204_007230 [Neospora caninum Liverpool]|eukprot:XP_003880283.1 hypothetical protein NCLIV_007230 [Neospora caninum Liverpool]